MLEIKEGLPMKKFVAALATGVMIAGASLTTVSAETYEVEKGDNLWDIAEEYNTTVKELVDINELDTTTIHPKQKLVINTMYIVERGDTLSKLAKEFDVSVSDIKKWNELDSSLIVIGQELEIKGVHVSKDTESDAEQITSYKKGKAEGKEKEIKKYNELNSSLIVIKKELEIKGVHVSKDTESDAEQVTSSKQGKAEGKEKQSVKSKEASKSADSSKTPEGKTITVSATAYTAKCDGCSGVTSTGVDLNANPNAKVIAVDPSVIPLGTEVYVEGYGYATAADVGGAIKGNKIDVHVPTKAEANSWGVKTVNVTIVE